MCSSQSPFSKSFLSMLEVQHLSSWTAHDTHIDIHLACWKFMSKAGSACRGSCSHSNWKMWSSEVALIKMGENSPDVNTCSDVNTLHCSSQLLDLRSEMRDCEKSYHSLFSLHLLSYDREYQRTPWVIWCLYPHCTFLGETCHYPKFSPSQELRPRVLRPIFAKGTQEPCSYPGTFSAGAGLLTCLESCPKW